MISFILKLVRGTRWLVMPALLGCALGVQTRAQGNDNQTVPAVAQPPAPQTEQAPRPGERDAQILPLLNLTPEQRAQLVAIAEQHRAEQQAAQFRLREARRALNQAIYAENPDQNVVNERAHDVAAAQEALIRLNAQAEFKVRQVLTPEQLRLFRRIRREQQRLRRGQPDDGLPRRPLLRDRLPNANRPPAVQPTDAGSAAPPDQARPRRSRRQPPGAAHTPRP